MSLLQLWALADGTPQEFPLTASYITEQLFCKVTQGDHAVPPKHHSSSVSEEAEGFTQNAQHISKLLNKEHQAFSGLVLHNKSVGPKVGTLFDTFDSIARCINRLLD